MAAMRSEEYLFPILFQGLAQQWPIRINLVITGNYTIMAGTSVVPLALKS